MKKIFLLVTALFWGIMCAFAEEYQETVYSLKKIHPMSELLCENIEALSTGEDDGYIRNEHGCIIWPAITCFGIVVTPEGSFAADFPDSRN